MAGMLGNLSSGILDNLATSNAWNLSLDESEGGSMGMGKSLGASLGLHDGDLGMFDTNDVATGAAVSILEGDDELTAGLAGLQPGSGSGTYTDPLLDESSFNTPAGWSSEASREGWGVESHASWGDSALNHGAAVDIGKAFEAFHGVGNSGVFGGMLGGGDSFSSHATPSKLGGWSGMMGMNDLSSDLQSNSLLGAGLQGGWEASPPDTFLPAGEEGGAMATTQRSGKGQRGGKNRQQRDSANKGGGGGGGGGGGRGNGRGGGRGAQAAETAVPAEVAGGNNNANASGTNGEAAVEGGQVGGGGGGREKRGGSRNTSGRTSKRGGDKGDKSDKSSKPQAEESGGGASTPSGPDSSGGDATASGQAGSKTGRGRARGGGKAAAVTVPANIRVAAQNIVKQQRDAAP